MGAQRRSTSAYGTYSTYSAAERGVGGAESCLCKHSEIDDAGTGGIGKAPMQSCMLIGWHSGVL